jgi:hypothetical protein
MNKKQGFEVGTCTGASVPWLGVQPPEFGEALPRGTSALEEVEIIRYIQEK